MSSHWKFEVHVKTPGEEDDEQEIVDHFAWIVKTIAGIAERDGLKIGVTEVERT